MNYLESIETAKVMTEKLIRVTLQTSIGGAARLLRERELSALPVVERDRLVSIISTSDLLEALGRSGMRSEFDRGIGTRKTGPY